MFTKSSVRKVPEKMLLNKEWVSICQTACHSRTNIELHTENSSYSAVESISGPLGCRGKRPCDPATDISAGLPCPTALPQN